MPGLVMRETRKRERMGKEGAIVQTANRGHFADARHSCYCLHTTSSSSWIFQRQFEKERTSSSLFGYLKQKETLPQIWTLLKCLQSFVQKEPHGDNIRERLDAEKFN